MWSRPKTDSCELWQNYIITLISKVEGGTISVLMRNII